MFKVKVTVKVQIVGEYFFRTISSEALEHLVTKLGMVMHHHEWDCNAERLVCISLKSSHSRISYDQNMTVSATSSELLILCNQTCFDGKS